MYRGVRGGFTLLEAALALAIIGVAAIAALTALAAELRTAERARWAVPATMLAEDRLAVLALRPPAELRTLPDSLARGRFEGRFTEYRWVAAVRPSAVEHGLYDVEIQVEWDGGRYALQSRVYRPEWATAR
jgi:type II secretion system protein I